jgi:asparagine synthase (glutamine-hydrolysing)
MCGITGIIGERATRAAVERMTATLAHRGPDDSGVWCSPGAAIGHRRLSILDLSDAAHQPMELGPLVLTYNGEIYNHQELRQGLQGDVRSSGDSEVLLHLYRERGDGFVAGLRGMYAFAIWDAERRRLFAARDAIGIKPFYYRPYADGLAFASELKALIALQPAEIDKTALRDYFTYKVAPPPKTIYQGIRQLPPGHTLVWEDGRVELKRFWHPVAETTISDHDEALERLGELLATVVPEQTLSEVPVGVFLSGGIDSATIAAHLDQPKTFTLGFDVGHWDESPAARAVAEHLGTEQHTEIATAIDLDDALSTIPGVYDEPFGDSGALSSLMVSRFARKQVKVVLSGEGGDELFAGYKSFGATTGAHWRALQRLLLPILPVWGRTARSNQRRAADGLERFSAFVGPFTVRQTQALLGPELAESGYDDLWHYREYWREDLDPIRRLQWIYLHTELPDSLLLKVDRASMAHSLEVRPPLLDTRMVQLALSIDTRFLRDAAGGKGKLLVRDLMEPRLPAGHFDRGKRGFNAPVEKWSKKHPGKLLAAVRKLADAGIIQPVPAAKLTNEQIWSLLVLERWMVGVGAL